MVNITLSVSVDMKDRMDLFPEINWSSVAREAIDDKIHDLELLKKFKEKSTFTDADAIKLGRELNKNLAARRK